MTTVSQWMQHPVHVIKPLDSIAHARDVMERHRINQLPVVVNDHLVGIVTDRDVRDVTPSIAQGFDGDDATAAVTVESVMSRTVLTVTPSDALPRAAALMRRERIGALPVVLGERVVGIVTRSDVLAAFSAEADRLSPPL